MTLRSSDLQSVSDLDSLRNSCDVYFIPDTPPFSVFIPSVGAAIVDNRGEVRRLGSFPNAHSAQVEVTTCQRGHYDDHDNSDSNNDFKNDCVQQTKSTITTTDNIFFWFSDSHVVSP